MTFRWRGGRSIYIYDQSRNFRLFEIWTFSNTIPTLDEAQRTIRRRIRSIRNGHTRIPGTTWAMKTRRSF